MRWMLVIVAVLAAALASTGAAPARSQDSAFERRVVLEQQVLRELNKVRAARGLTTLRAATGLQTAAARHSRSMLVLGFFAHESVDGTPFQHRIRRHYPSRGWESWSVGETLLAMNTWATDARSIVGAWLASPRHRDIILSAGWRDAGIGAFYRDDAPGSYGGMETLVVTADFGLRSGKQRLLQALS